MQKVKLKKPSEIEKIDDARLEDKDDVEKRNKPYFQQVTNAWDDIKEKSMPSKVGPILDNTAGTDVGKKKDVSETDITNKTGFRKIVNGMCESWDSVREETAYNKTVVGKSNLPNLIRVLTGVRVK
jgi:hypothetical protein